jgi:hypothetical protein
MASGIYVPRINNNDESRNLVGLEVAVGSQVTKGQRSRWLRTDKASSYRAMWTACLSIQGSLETLQVGSVLLCWISQSPDEAVPSEAQPALIPLSLVWRPPQRPMHCWPSTD